MSNRLANSSSPYLLQHANNPVDWYPWGDEAFERARAASKLIFLSIGYSTCHWCHVMERESFENEAIAALLNRHFVNIKLDREERPDIDRVYMAFVQATTGSGGWPMSVWLTPDLEPVFGGTYFPPEDRYGRMGFPAIIQRIAEAWQTDCSQMKARAREIADALRESARETAADERVNIDQVFTRAADQFISAFDETHGGLGSAPKFPRASPYELLLRHSLDPGARNCGTARRVVLESLRKMAAGGIYDHLGGGFHRYSVDERWHVPHFEKMLYDQAQLAALYLDAWKISSEPLFEQVVRGTLDYVLRDLTSPHGGHYSAEDADSLPNAASQHKNEGAFYIWEKDEVGRLLGPDAALFNDAYGLSSHGNVSPQYDPHGELAEKNILFRRIDDAALSRMFGASTDEVRVRLANAREILREARNSRPRPHLDDKVITAWNGLMISALARAGAALGEKRYLEAAEKTARFLKDFLYESPSGQLVRSRRCDQKSGPAFAEDYAFLIQGLIDLYECGGDPQWLSWAVNLQERMDALFRDPNDGSYYNSASDRADVLVRMREDDDGAEPAASSVAAHNLRRLGLILALPELRDKAAETIRAFATHIERVPAAMPLLLCAWNDLHREEINLIITGAADNALFRAAHAAYTPGRAIVHAATAAGLPTTQEHRDFLANLQQSCDDSTPRAFLCRGITCSLPISSPEELRRSLDQTMAEK